MIGDNLQFILLDPGLTNKGGPLRHGELTHSQLRGRAANILGNARTYGRVCNQPCCICGAGKAHAHHEDYTVPHVITFLCPKHHGGRHAELRRGAKSAIPKAMRKQALRYIKCKLARQPISAP